MKHDIQVCVGTRCRKQGSQELLDWLDAQLHQHHIEMPEMEDELNVFFCQKYCDNGPVIRIGDNVYCGVTQKKVEEIYAAIRSQNETRLCEMRDDVIKSEV